MKAWETHFNFTGTLGFIHPDNNSETSFLRAIITLSLGARPLDSSGSQACVDIHHQKSYHNLEQINTANRPVILAWAILERGGKLIIPV